MILALVTVLYQLQINAKVEDDITGTLFDTVFKCVSTLWNQNWAGCSSKSHA